MAYNVTAINMLGAQKVHMLIETALIDEADMK